MQLPHNYQFWLVLFHTIRITVVCKHICNAIQLAIQSRACFTIASACDGIATRLLQLCLYTGVNKIFSYLIVKYQKLVCIKIRLVAVPWPYKYKVRSAL